MTTSKQNLILEQALALIQSAKKSATPNGLSRIDEINLHTSGYAEPGYDDKEVVATGNWNTVSRWDEATKNIIVIDETPAQLAKELEKLGVELEWSDEWDVCSDCGKLILTSANSYSWQRSYWDDDCIYHCHECVKKNPSDYLESLENNERAAVTFDVNLEESGYMLLSSDFEHGLHDGQNASPIMIANALRDQGVTRFIFRMDRTGQFDVSFSVYVHKDEIENLDKDKFDSAPKDGPDIAKAMQKALKDAALKIGVLPDDRGVKVAKCHLDGTASVKVVSPQDFIDGKALDMLKSNWVMWFKLIQNTTTALAVVLWWLTRLVLACLGGIAPRKCEARLERENLGG